MLQIDGLPRSCTQACPSPCTETVGINGISRPRTLCLPLPHVKRVIHIALSILLISSLGLSQIGAGFFHNKHDAHENAVLLDEGEFAITAHGEHCKLCAIDLITLYNESPEYHQVEATIQRQFILPIISKVSVSKAFASGRAPPVLS